MNKIAVKDLAQEMGVPVDELRRVAAELGVTLDGPNGVLDGTRAESLRAAIQGLVLASRQRQARTNPTDIAGVVNQAPAGVGNQAQSLLLVNMLAHNVRVSLGYEQGFNNMLKVIAALLADARQTVRRKHDTVPWGDMYFLRADLSTPVNGFIELEYGDTTEIGFGQRQKGILGDIWWSAAWLNESWTRPLEKLGMVVGLLRDPEADYRNQLASDLHALAAQGLLDGVDEWEITTGGPGRNLYLTPRANCLPTQKADDGSMVRDAGG